MRQEYSMVVSVTGLAINIFNLDLILPLQISS